LIFCSSTAVPTCRPDALPVLTGELDDPVLLAELAGAATWSALIGRTSM
jgi:hypothetical protein